MEITSKVKHLAGSTVGQALFSISSQIEVGGTGTLVASSRREQTQVTAATIILLTRVT